VKPWQPIRGAMAVGMAACCFVVSTCAAGMRRGPEITRAASMVEGALAGSGVRQPMRVIFNWEYTGSSGRLRGEGVARVNPPDRFRLDFFGPAEGAMQATLVDGVLTASGDLEALQLPPATFLYAMAGLFRPPDEVPRSGFVSGPFNVFEYEGPSPGGHQFFFLDGDRLDRLEEHRDGRRQRWITLERGIDSHWPDEASYRDAVNRNGVRWELLSVETVAEAYDEAIYSIPEHR